MQMNGQWYTELESYGNPMCFTVELTALFTAAARPLCTIMKISHSRETVSHFVDYAYNIKLTKMDQSFKSCRSIRRPSS